MKGSARLLLQLPIAVNHRPKRGCSTLNEPFWLWGFESKGLSLATVVAHFAVQRGHPSDCLFPTWWVSTLWPLSLYSSITYFLIVVVNYNYVCIGRVRRQHTSLHMLLVVVISHCSLTHCWTTRLLLLNLHRYYLIHLVIYCEMHIRDQNQPS